MFLCCANTSGPSFRGFLGFVVTRLQPRSPFFSSGEGVEGSKQTNKQTKMAWNVNRWSPSFKVGCTLFWRDSGAAALGDAWVGHLFFDRTSRRTFGQRGRRHRCKNNRVYAELAAHHPHRYHSAALFGSLLRGSISANLISSSPCHRTLGDSCVCWGSLYPFPLL